MPAVPLIMKRKPLVWIRSGTRWRIDWTKLTLEGEMGIPGGYPQGEFQATPDIGKPTRSCNQVPDLQGGEMVTHLTNRTVQDRARPNSAGRSSLAAQATHASKVR